MDRSRKPKSNLASHRRLELLDLNNSSSSLNMSTSSLRSIAEETRRRGVAGDQATSRRSTTVRFAPPPPAASSSSPAAVSMKPSSGPVSQSKQAIARPATASGARPGSATGPRCRTSAGRLPEPGPKAIRRSWGWATDGADPKEQGKGDSVGAKVLAKTQSRSSSAPRRLPPEKEKPLPKRGSKIMTANSRTTKANPDSHPKPEMEERRSPPNTARNNMKAPNRVSLKNMHMVSPPTRTTIGASWESLPSDLQNLGLEVMRYRDDTEAAAVEALRESSAAEILLRCLSAFADLTAAVAEQSPAQTVDEFLALHAGLASSATAIPRGDKQEAHAGDWLRAAVTTDLAHFSLYSAAASPPSPSRISSSAASPAVSSPAPAPLARRLVPSGDGSVEESWLEAARSGLAEEMRAWFLRHVERLLDGDVAGTLGQLKRVNDWLDAVGLGPESEAVERVRKKIYGYLLEHVESAVVALNGSVADGRRK